MNKMNKFLSFSEARRFSRSLNFKTVKQWMLYASSDNRPNNIPSNPKDVYKTNFKGYPDWLGYSFDRHTHAINSSRKYKVNHNFFKVWSHDMAYILGLWWADGCIQKNLFTITQSVKDKYILDNIALIMESNRPIQKRNPRYAFDFKISSEKIVNDICSIGGKERKSLDIGFPKIPNKFLPDFIRGYFDGDGYIGLNKNNRLAIVICSGSDNFMKRLFKVIKLNIKNINGRLCKVDYFRGKNKHVIYRIEFGHNDTIRFCEYIYHKFGNLKLKRKYDIFIDNNFYVKIKKGFVNYEKSKMFAKKMKFKNRREWAEFSKTHNKPFDIPSNPQTVYKNEKWKGWREFLSYA
jgi:hypothetical protein